MSIDVRILRHFVILASERHFGRAAVSIGIAQSALSTQVARLEDVLGGRLLDRGKRAAVQLTPLGATFLPEAVAAIAQLDRAERIGQQAARGNAGPACIAYVLSAALTGTLTQALGAVKADRPLIDLRAIPLETPEQLRMIADAELDAGFIRPQDRYPPGVSAAIVHREPLLLAVASDHHLAQKPSCHAAELAHETFIVPQVARSMGLPRLVARLAEAGRFSAPDIFDSSDYVTAISMAAAGYGVVLSPRSWRRVAMKDVVYCPIIDFKETVDLALAWRDPASSLVEAILNTLHKDEGQFPSG